MHWATAIGVGIAFLAFSGVVVFVLTRDAAWFALVDRPWQMLRSFMGWGLKPEELARRLDLPLSELTDQTPVYRDARIPKRGGGVRRLRIPDETTKRIQRRILRRLLTRLRSHPAATAYERGRSIVDNALPHQAMRVVIRCDVVDFFGSTRSERVVDYFRRIGWGAEAAALLTRWCVDGDGLPQGAPTSPRLSNLVNFGLDAELSQFAARYHGAYTRYADDITFSFPRWMARRRPRSALDRAKRALRRRGYTMHRRRKKSIRRRHQRQCVTGLVVNDKVQLPRERRRWLRAVMHNRMTGMPVTLTDAQLHGWLGLRQMIERQTGRAGAAERSARG